MADPTDEPRIFKPGDAFLHYPYVVERFLGEGASGQVYAARHRFTDERRALKTSHLANHRFAKRVARALFEAQASYCIRHEYVVQVFDIGCEDDGLVWQIMELLDGHPVGVLLARFGRFSPIQAIDVAIEVAWGLQAAHELEVVHRDVQPSNVFVTREGRVKVLDFSLSKWVRSPLKTTHGRRPRGTAGYMAPEHLKGAEPTPQFDVYGLGILLWQMLAGRHPFEESLDNCFRMVEQQMGAEPASLADAAGLPAYCDDVVRGAIAKDPTKRYAGMWPFAQALTGLRERLLADESAALRVRFGAAWERQVPILRGNASTLRYAPPRPAPAPAPARDVPSARVIVAQPSPGGGPASEAARPPAESTTAAGTVRMEAVPGIGEAPPAPEPWVDRTPAALAAPAALRPPARWRWAAIGVPASIALGGACWALAGPAAVEGAAAPAAAPPPSTSPAPPRASAPSASAPSTAGPRPAPSAAAPRRGSPSRPKR